MVVSPKPQIGPGTILKMHPTLHSEFLNLFESIVKNVLLTNDLTEKVMQEAILIGANVIISYHPPLFKEFKRISQNNWKDRLVTQGWAQYNHALQACNVIKQLIRVHPKVTPTFESCCRIL